MKFEIGRNARCGITVFIVSAVSGLAISGASAAITHWSGGIAIAKADAPLAADQSFTLGSLNPSGGSFVLNGGSVPEIRIEFNGFDPEQPRMVNTNFAPVATSNELGGTGLKQFGFGDEIGPTVPSGAWGGQGFFDAPDSDPVTNPTIWNTDTEGYAGFRVDVGGGNYHYGWALFEYLDEGHTVELLALAMESEVNKPIAAGAIPEPSAMALAGLSVVFAFLRRRRSVPAIGGKGQRLL